MNRAYLTIEKQCELVRANWPLFKARSVSRTDQRARWVGQVRPQFASFSVEIRYRVGKFPETRVLSPELPRLPENPEGALPHVYPPLNDPQLCLFDPAQGQWNAMMSIAHTIIPWAMDWLCCYEMWLMTGSWTGGGRHAGEPVLEAAP